VGTISEMEIQAFIRPVRSSHLSDKRKMIEIRHINEA